MNNKKNVLVLYIANNGNDRWSGKLDAPNKQKTDGPLASLKGARDTIRKLKKNKNFSCPVNVYLREGFYQLDEQLIFKPEDSGKKDAPITYQAYPKEKPIISGGKRICDWHQKSDNLWIVKIPKVEKDIFYFSQIFVNGERRYRTRLPKKGFYHIQQVPEKKDTCKGFYFTSNDINANWKNLTDIKVVVLHLWTDVHLPIKAVDQNIGWVSFIRQSRRWLSEGTNKTGARYYVENVFEALTEPGEWYIDRKDGLIYYLAKHNEDMNKAEVYAPYLSQLIRLEGNPEKGKFIEYIVFSGLSFCHTEWTLQENDAGDYQAAVEVPASFFARGARRCSIHGCHFKNIGTYGIEFNEGCMENHIVGNEISESGAGGIHITGGDAASPIRNRTKKNIITDNHLFNLGQIYHSAVGILIRHSSENIISYNHIHHLYYTGISIGWIWGYKKSVSRNNHVEFNHIHDIGMGLLADMGGIYTLGISPGTVLRYNLIHNVDAYNYGGWAIYPDEGSSHIIIEKNICFDTSHHVFHQHYGQNNIVRNNIFAFGKKGQVAYTKSNHKKGFTFRRNIVLSEGMPFFTGGYSHNLEEYKFNSDLNIFWDVKKKKNAILGQDIQKENLPEPLTYRWTDWQKLGYDRHSILANPLFLNWLKRNFSLKKMSPAYKLGFKPFKIDKVGPRVRWQKKI